MASPCCEANAQKLEKTAENFSYQKMESVQKGEEIRLICDALIGCRLVVPANAGIQEIEWVSENRTSACIRICEQRVHSRQPPNIGPLRCHSLDACSLACCVPPAHQRRPRLFGPIATCQHRADILWPPQLSIPRILESVFIIRENNARCAIKFH